MGKDTLCDRSVRVHFSHFLHAFSRGPRPVPDRSRMAPRPLQDRSRIAPRPPAATPRRPFAACSFFALFACFFKRSHTGPRPIQDGSQTAPGSLQDRPQRHREDSLRLSRFLTALQDRLQTVPMHFHPVPDGSQTDPEWLPDRSRIAPTPPAATPRRPFAALSLRCSAPRPTPDRCTFHPCVSFFLLIASCCAVRSSLP